MSNHKTLDLIIPCFNPTLNWSVNVVERFNELQYLIKGYSISLILVNDGSLSGVRNNHIEYLNQNINSFQYIALETNCGKGAALRKGVSFSNADFCMFTDIDFPFTNKSMNEVAMMLTNENVIVTGYRSSEYYQHIPFFRKWLSKSFRFVIAILSGVKTDDTQCGLKAFGKKGKELFLATTTNRYLFDFEFLKLASKNPDIEIKPVLVHLREGVSFTKMNIKILMKEFRSFMVLIFKR